MVESLLASLYASLGINQRLRCLGGAHCIVGGLRLLDMLLLAPARAPGVLAVLVETVLAFGSWRLLPDACWVLWFPTESSGCHFGKRCTRQRLGRLSGA